MVHDDVARAIDDDRTAAIGPDAELLARYPAAECIDGYGKAVMPAVRARLGPDADLNRPARARNMAEDIVEVMRTALCMEGVRRQDGRHPTPEQALLRALGIADAGWLAPGNKADLIMVDLRQAHLVPWLRSSSGFHGAV